MIPKVRRGGEWTACQQAPVCLFLLYAAQSPACTAAQGYPEVGHPGEPETILATWPVLPGSLPLSPFQPLGQLGPPGMAPPSVLSSQTPPPPIKEVTAKGTLTQ